MLLVYFAEDPTDLENDKLIRCMHRDRALRKLLEEYSLVRVSLSAEETDDGKTFRLIDHEAFAELGGGPGLAIVDMTDEESAHHGYVVSIYPLDLPEATEAGRLKALLGLPPGTLTQRTLIWAVRVHPEEPASTAGKINNELVHEAESHSQHQASIRLQGHHRWESRFHRITAKLPDGLLAQEVCAESWPDEGLVEAALDCVDSWRQSPGHWNAVAGHHEYYGYDMKCGSNGIWYATGIFSSDP